MIQYQDEKSCAESTRSSTDQDRDVLLQELDSSKEQLEILSKRYEQLEAKSKAERKVLVKEVKSLRSSQSELEHELSKALKEKSEAEVVYYSVKLYILFKLLLCQISYFRHLPFFKVAFFVACC